MRKRARREYAEPLRARYEVADKRGKGIILLQAPVSRSVGLRADDKSAALPLSDPGVSSAPVSA